MVEDNVKGASQGVTYHTFSPEARATHKLDFPGLKHFVFEYGHANHAANYIEVEEEISNCTKRVYTNGVIQTLSMPSGQENSK